VLVIGFGNRAGGLHRVHEAQHRFGQVFAHQPHFSDRGDVVMGYPGVPQHLQQRRRRIGLHRIERFSGELLAEETRRARSGVRAVENDRFVRRKGAGYCRSVWIMVQLKGPPIGLPAR
jgi:hypothetical protein